jgi:hypothetical protein
MQANIPLHTDTHAKRSIIDHPNARPPPWPNIECPPVGKFFVWGKVQTPKGLFHPIPSVFIETDWAGSTESAFYKTVFGGNYAETSSIP